MKVAIILARGGSKRVPGKNIKEFCGAPMISWPIRAARKSRLFDSIIVSTDDMKIAKTAQKWGAEVPFLRPKELADDMTPTIPVLSHTIKWLKENNRKPIYFCCLYGTSAFALPEYLNTGFDSLVSERATSAFSVTSFPGSIFRALKLSANGKLSMFWPEHENARSNDLPEAYQDAGQFYWVNTNKFLIEKKIYSSNSVPVIMPRRLVHDIDTLEDWDVAEQLFEHLEIDEMISR